MNVFLLATITADGFIARDVDHLATTWTTKTDKALFTRLTKKAGVVVMGWNTYSTFGKALPGRRLIVYSRHDREVPEGVEVTTKDPRELLGQLEAEGAKAVAICGGPQIYRLFMDAAVISEVYLTVQPVFFGQGITLFNHDLDTKLLFIDGAFSAEDSTTTLHYRLS